MPLTKNPFADDPDKAEVFEMGYLLTLQGIDDDRFCRCRRICSTFSDKEQRRAKAMPLS
jgi:hypothetical protein